MCGPDGTKIDGVPVWWCDGPLCQMHSDRGLTCAKSMPDRGYVTALTPEATDYLQTLQQRVPYISQRATVGAISMLADTASTATPPSYMLGEFKLSTPSELVLPDVEEPVPSEPVATTPIVDASEPAADKDATIVEDESATV